MWNFKIWNRGWKHTHNLTRLDHALVEKSYLCILFFRVFLLNYKQINMISFIYLYIFIFILERV